MKIFILGCPYKDIDMLKTSLKKISSSNDFIFDVDDILTLDFEKIYFKNYKQPIKINKISASFIRYPYDLIPPHNQNYALREKTEFYKSISFLLSNSAINKILPSIKARNRMASLNEARKIGLKVPDSYIIEKKNNQLTKITKSKNLITKSLGNCYYSEKIDNKNKFIKKILSYENDGEDSAYIYPAHQFKNKQSIDKYINEFGTLFVQDELKGKEYRVYIINNKIFFYQRDEKNKPMGVDKSGNILIKSNLTLDKSQNKKLITLRKNLNLNYLCLDIIIKKDNDLYVIDINPFGSFPQIPNNTEVTYELAKYMYSYNC